MKQTILFLFLCGLSSIVRSQHYPQGFSQVDIATGISFPTVFDFCPDGRIFVAQQDGALRVIKNGVLLPTPAIDLDVDMNGERGLVGIAVHPDFNNNHYVYLYHTLASGTKHNRISRFTFIGDVIDPASEHIILELDPLSTSNIHNSGCMKFTQDGKLIVSVGDTNEGLNSQDLDTYHGKILRINPDGSVPSDNPYATGPTPQRQRVWAMGLRNPFTFDIHPTSGKIFVNEVGHALCEEINDASVPGVNFGWPIDQCRVEGTSYKNPVFFYYHTGDTVSGCAITGGTFFSPSATNYPTVYKGNYFFVDYCNNWIRYINPQVSNPTSSVFATALPPNCLYLKTGPDGNMYFLCRSTGSIYKIAYTQNTAPLINDQPQSVTVATTQQVTFTVSVSGVPPFNYQWKKDGVAIPGATSAEYTINNVTTAQSGNYSVQVTNTYGIAASQPATLTVIATTPPVAHILSPVNGTTYQAGNVINFSGEGTDAEDGTLPASAFTWRVEFWHGTGTHQHVHDGPPIAEGIKSGSFTIPTNNETATDVFYRLILRVKDSKNIFNETHVDILPRLSTVTLAANPTGFQVLLDGQARNAPFSFQGVEGIERTIGVVTPQVLNSTTYKFDKWSQGGNASQTIQTPENDVTYTALFKVDTDLRDPDNPSDPIAGIKYSYYEGRWLVLPDFNSLTPVKTGVVPDFNLSQANQEDYYAFKFTGYIDILQDGVYKFYTNSNDGSKLYIGNRQVVNNDAVHTAFETSATIGLKKGKHQITVTYFEFTGANNLTVSYSADFLPKQPIPASVLYHTIGEPVNSAPIVSITSPVDNQEYPDHSNILIQANASDPDGTISKIEFYQAGERIGEDLDAPYEFLWEHIHEGTYTFTVKAYDNQNASSTSSAVTVHVGGSTESCTASGNITRDYWTTITGTSVSAIPITTTPNGSELLTILEAPQNWGNNYGNRIRGYICAPLTGTYYFWISSNDNGELWLSTDKNPDNKIKIAEVTSFSNYRQWDKFPRQQSEGILLNAGQSYYIEALHKEGINADHLSIGWQLPDGTMERPVPGSRLSPFGNLSNQLPVVQLTSPVNNQYFNASSSITLSATASDPDGTISKVEFYQNDVKLGEDPTAPYEFTWNNVPAGNFIITVKAYDNQNSVSSSTPALVYIGAPCPMEGSITREYWTGVHGSSVSDIPLYTPPSGTEQLTFFEAPQNWADNYGTRVRGYICAPLSGNYIFWIASNDDGELWLSTDNNPENKERIAYVGSYTSYRQWDKLTSQRSAVITLEAGQKYYIEALQKEGIHNDHLSVGWQLPDSTLELPIPGMHLSPYTDTTSSQQIQSIDLLTNDQNLKVAYKVIAFPNPVETGSITLAIEGYEGKTKAFIRITDLNGKEYHSERISCDITCPRTLINLHEKFLPGIYLISVEIGDQHYSEKLIIK